MVMQCHMHKHKHLQHIKACHRRPTWGQCARHLGVGQISAAVIHGRNVLLSVAYMGTVTALLHLLAHHAIDTQAVHGCGMYAGWVCEGT